MFITSTELKSPASDFFFESGQTCWTGAELALEQIWFLVRLEMPEHADGQVFSMSRSLIFSDFSSIESYIDLMNRGQLLISSVHLVTPGHINGTGTWEMHRLKSVWEGKEPFEDNKIPMNVFETTAGRKFSAVFSNLSESQMRSEVLKYQFSEL